MFKHIFLTHCEVSLNCAAKQSKNKKRKQDNIQKTQQQTKKLQQKTEIKKQHKN